MPENPINPPKPESAGGKPPPENLAEVLAEAAEEVSPRPEASIPEVTFGKAFTGILGVWYDRALYNLAEKPEGTAEAAAQELFYNYGTTPEQLKAVSAQLEEDKSISTSAGEISPTEDTKLLAQQTYDALSSFREQHPNLTRFYSGYHDKAFPSKGVQGRAARGARRLRRAAGRPVKWGLRKLAKTGIGQAVKKGAAWLAARFGLATIASAVGTPLLGVAVLAVSAVLKFVKRALSDPVKALVAGGALLLGALLLPLPLIAKLGLFGLGAILGIAPLLGSFVGLAGAAGAALISFIVMLIPFIAVPLLTALGIAVVVTTAAVFLLVAWFMHATTAARFLITGTVPSFEAADFDVTKQVAPKMEFENDELPVTLTYTITVVPLEGARLLNVNVEETTTVFREVSPPSVPSRSWEIASLDSTWTQSYDQEIDSRFTDSLIMNTVTVTADVEEGPAREQESAGVTVQVGNPPEDCPAGWPTLRGYITQGPGDGHRESIDIGVGRVLTVQARATHNGAAYFTENAGNAGNRVDIEGRCRLTDGTVIPITTHYAHLDQIFITRQGAPVNRGDPVGTVGQTGNARGIHLHYEFLQNHPMAQSYIPVDENPRGESIRGCSSVAECGVSWP